MRTELIKYLDKYRISDGVLRVFCSEPEPNVNAILDAIDAAIVRREEETEALNHLREVLENDVDNPRIA